MLKGIFNTALLLLRPTKNWHGISSIFKTCVVSFENWTYAISYPLLTVDNAEFSIRFNRSWNVTVLCRSIMAKASHIMIKGLRFDSQQPHCHATSLEWVAYRMCRIVTMQWCSEARNVTAGQVECHGSLRLVLSLTSPDCLENGISSDSEHPTLSTVLCHQNKNHIW